MFLKKGEVAELVEGARLLSEYGAKNPIEGSNPSLSVIAGSNPAFFLKGGKNSLPY